MQCPNTNCNCKKILHLARVCAGEPSPAVHNDGPKVRQLEIIHYKHEQRIACLYDMKYVIS